MIHMTFELRPAFKSLECAYYDIEQTHGENVAVEWMIKTLSADTDLFYRIYDGPPTPRLTLIRGGA